MEILRGLLYGQGEYVTKHHALVVARRPPDVPLSETYSVQQRADATRGPVPALLEDYAGTATVETHTIVYDRDGQPEFGTVLARIPEGSRLMARVPKEDAASLRVLADPNRSPVGASGRVEPHSDGLLRFGF